MKLKLKGSLGSIGVKLAGKTNPRRVKPVLCGHTKIDKTKILLTNGILMKVESITECSPMMARL